MTDQKTEKAIRAAITLLDGDLDHENAEAMRSLLSKLRAEGVQAGDERAVMAEATAYVTEALIYVDRVAQRKAIGYADVGTNPRRHHNDTRPYNIKDARSDAYTAALLLRKAWDLLDPSISVRPVTALASAPVAGEAVGQVVLFGMDLKEVSWREGKIPPPGTMLYAAPQADKDGEAVRIPVQRGANVTGWRDPDLEQLK